MKEPNKIKLTNGPESKKVKIIPMPAVEDVDNVINFDRAAYYRQRYKPNNNEINKESDKT